MSNAMELEAFLYGALQPSAHDREVIAQALNERFVELGGNHPVPYSASDADGRWDDQGEAFRGRAGFQKPVR